MLDRKLSGVRHECQGRFQNRKECSPTRVAVLRRRLCYLIHDIWEVGVSQEYVTDK